MADDTEKQADAAAEKAFAAAASQLRKPKQPRNRKTTTRKADLAGSAAAVPAPESIAPAETAPAVAEVEAPDHIETETTPDSEAISQPSIAELKERIMATAPTENFTNAAQNATDKVQSQLKSAYEKGTELASEMTEFTKGNVEALVESSKILASGMQELGREAVEETKSAYEAITDDVKKMVAVKSPTEFFQLQGEFARRNFDALVSTTSKNTESVVKLANEALAPISGRFTAATEKFAKVA